MGAKAPNILPFDFVGIEYVLADERDLIHDGDGKGLNDGGGKTTAEDACTVCFIAACAVIGGGNL